MTELVLIWLGTVAVLASVGVMLPADRKDGFTEMLLPFVAAILWVAVAFGASDVLPTAASSRTSIMPLFWLAAMFAMLMLVLGIYAVVKQPAQELQDRSDGRFDL